MIETKLKADYTGEAKLGMHENEVPEFEAKLAFAMIERWGMIAGTPDGEDSAGRAKITTMPVDELVGKAFETARLAMKMARDKKLIHKAPTLAEMETFEKAEKQRKEQQEKTAKSLSV